MNTAGSFLIYGMKALGETFDRVSNIYTEWMEQIKYCKYEKEIEEMDIREARLKAGLTQQSMSDLLEIPKRAIEGREGAEKTTCLLHGI